MVEKGCVGELQETLYSLKVCLSERYLNILTENKAEKEAGIIRRNRFLRDVIYSKVSISLQYYTCDNSLKL